MSERTECNYCSLKFIKQDAKKKNMKVIMLSSNFMGGTDIFVVPRSISLGTIRQWKDCDKCPPNGDKNYCKYHVAWMQEITSYCCC